MGLTYFKRYRMEIDLTQARQRNRLPYGYRLIPWHASLLDSHSDTKYRSFCLEIDANVFPCLGDRDGCRRLMTEISTRESFVPGATWLLAYQPVELAQAEHCGTVQGLSDQFGFGAIQNLGVTPMHRGRGLGTVLLLRALDGFQEAGLDRAFLEVTAQNYGAVRLYERLGFRRVKTVYKAAEVAFA